MEPNDESCEVRRDQVGAQFDFDVDEYDDDELEDEDQGELSRVGLNYVAEPIMDASFQDDFDDIHSDYQWFTESGFAADATNLDVGNFPTPLCIGVGTDLEFDATMAHIDMEDFQSQDILLRFPPLSASDLQPHQGETIASITGSILQQFDFESSMTQDSHSVEEDDQQHQSMDMSICKSENLFSPVAENQQHLPLSTFSTDSLDARGETILATCMTNRNNYTIAFQGLELEESTTSSTYRTAHDNNLISPASDMTENEMTNWRQLKTSNGNGGNRNNNRYSKNNASDNNNGGSNTGSTETNSDSTQHSHYMETRSLLTQSCPNPWFWKKNSLVFNNNNPKNQTAAFVKLFDIHMSRPGSLGKDSNSMTESNVHMMTTGSGSGGSGNGSRLDNVTSAAGTGSTGSSARTGSGGYMMEESWNNNRNPNPNPFRIRTKFEKARPTTTTQIAEAIKKSRSIQIQTSTIKLKPKKKEGEFTPYSTPKKSSPVFVCFPSYTLPDLKFLQKRSFRDEENDEMSLPEVYLLPQKYKVPTRPKKNESENGGGGGNGRGNRGRRPMSCNDIEDLRKRDLSHVRDWPSLNFLLPQEYQSILEVMKPLEKREQSDETEKERDACVPVASAPAHTSEPDQHHLLGENNEPVILRKKPGRNHQRGSTKRFSLNDTSSAGSPGRNDRGFAEKFKRFSLQETLPEVAEITTEIAKNLEQLESLANHLGNDFPGGIDSNDNIPQEQTDSSDSCGHHHNRRVPNNTPKHTSYVDFDNHFKTLEEGAAKIVAHIAPMCSLGSPTKHSRIHVDMVEKQSLTDGIAAAVTQIQASWTPPSATAMDNRHVKGSGGRHLTSYPNLMIMSQSPGGRMVLETLCPALYSLLSDGLCPFLETIFGRVPNTVWRVVEASIQYGPTAQTLNELVLRINSEELLAEGPMKLNAFVCGLLNLGNLGSWLTFLRTKERLLRTHYDPEAFMFLCNTSTRFLYDQMLVNMHILSRLPFQLDIFHETKLLHQSMNPSFMSSKSSNHTLPVLRKNSTKGSSRSSAAPNVRKSTSADARIPKPQSKNSKYFANQLKKSQMKRSFSDERPKINKTPSTIPKSKTAQNIQNERQYSSSGVPKPTSYGLARFPSKPKISNICAEAASDREKGMEPTKAQRPKSIEGDGLTETNKDPDRFRRLQMQWELLSSDDSRKTTSPVSGVPNSSNPALAGSKIPRPITSPIRTYHPGLPGSGPNVRPTSRR